MEAKPQEERARVRTPVGEVSKTKQSFAEETDVNAIMRKYQATGILEHQNTAVPRYGDFTNADSYLEAVNQVKHAEALFAKLPAKVRDHVKNDPGRLLDMVFDPERRAELEELGLVAPEVVEEPPEVVEDPPPETPAEA